MVPPKPDFVEHAGNLAVMRMAGRTTHRGLGVVTTTVDLQAGTFREEIGTNFAAPAVCTERLSCFLPMPNASHNLLRALLGAHASVTRQSPC